MYAFGLLRATRFFFADVFSDGAYRLRLMIEWLGYSVSVCLIWLIITGRFARSHNKGLLYRCLSGTTASYLRSNI